MNAREKLIWAAGMINGVGILAVTHEVGPTGREYAALSLLCVTGDSVALNRMISAAGNGNAARDLPSKFVWELGGEAAVMGFIREIWPHLTPATQKVFNDQLRKFKELKQIAS